MSTSTSAARPTVLLVIGGRSAEHAISCVSGGGVLSAWPDELADVVVVGIAKAGTWHAMATDVSSLAIGQDGGLPGVDPSLPLANLRQTRSGVVLDIEGAPGPVAIDAVFPLLHGPHGEDGTVQGLFETLGLPYVGSGVLSSAQTMDKPAMKHALAAHGLPVGPYEVVHDGEWRVGAGKVAERLAFALSLPVFVKPARAGSSMGITRLDDWSGLADAMDVARTHDLKVIVEQGIDGREIECGVLGASRDDRATASPCAEIVVRDGRAFYDFEAKYLQADTAVELIVPADLDPVLASQLRDLAIRSFEALECEGLARVDFFVPTAGSPVINEVNTMPGFTPTSMFPRMWAAGGVDYPALIERLLLTVLPSR